MPAVPAPTADEIPRSLDFEQCMEFARGKVGIVSRSTVRGSRFVPDARAPAGRPAAAGRSHRRDRGRAAVDDATAASSPSTTCTTTAGISTTAAFPTCVAVEAGQADLFLSGFLGIDFKTRGLACYRLLDAVVTFHRELPKVGELIRYDIRIDHFFRQGETYLFRFRFDGTVNGEPLLTMRDGCAGFFTAEELAGGKGDRAHGARSQADAGEEARRLVAADSVARANR